MEEKEKGFEKERIGVREKNPLRFDSHNGFDGSNPELESPMTVDLPRLPTGISSLSNDFGSNLSFIQVSPRSVESNELKETPQKTKRTVSFKDVEYRPSSDDYDSKSDQASKSYRGLERIGSERSRQSKSPRHKDGYLSSQSYYSLMADTTTVAPSKVNYSKVIHKHRSMENMIHPVEKHAPELAHRKNIHVQPSKAFVHQFDYVIVFPYHAHEERGQSTDTKYIMHSMLLAGLELFPYLSSTGEELIVLIRCPEAVLKILAEKSEILFPTNPAMIKELLSKGDPENHIVPVKIRHDPTITPIEPHDYISLKFKQTVDQKLYFTSTLLDGYLFPKNLRLKLIHFLLTAPRRLRGCNLEISRLLLRKKVLAIFPIHDADICHDILSKCFALTTMPWNAPTEELRQYLGEKIGLFMVFLGHLSKWFVPVGIVGIGAQIVIWVTGNYSHPVAPIYAVILIMWSIIIMGFWKREQSLTALKWGMTAFVETQYERPEFMGQLQLNSFVNGKEMLYFPRIDFRQRILVSLTAILAFVLLVIGVITGIYLLRFFVQSSLGSVTTVIAAILNVIEILSLNFIYQQIAVKLTNQENHRLDTEYEDALIAKVFVFQFINSYASLFFLAFIAAYLPSNTANQVGQCGDVNCVRPMALSLGLIIVSRMIFKNLMDLILPYLNYLNFLRKKAQALKKNPLPSSQSSSSVIPTESAPIQTLTPPEMDYLLREHDAILENVRAFSDSAVQYGYTVLFIAALPIAPILTVLYYYIKIKLQSWKVLMLFQRPHPAGAQSIGSWETIFTLLSVISVVTNAGIISFTMDVMSDYSYAFRVWVFIGFQWLMLCLQYTTSVLIPEESEMVQIQKARMNFINEKLILKYPDEDYEEDAMYYSDDEDDEICPINLSEGVVPDPEAMPINNNFSPRRSFVVKTKTSDHRAASTSFLRLPSPSAANARAKRKVYLKRLQNGFYQQEEMLDPCSRLWQTIERCCHKMDEAKQAVLVMNSVNTSDGGEFGRGIQLPHLSASNDGNSSVASSILPPSVQISSKKREYRQRLKFNDENLHYKLEPLNILAYPHTEDLHEWNLPISKEVIEYEPDLDLYKLDLEF